MPGTNAHLEPDRRSPLIKPKVELPDDFDMRPVQIPRVKQKAIELTSAPVATTTKQTTGDEATATTVMQTVSVTSTTTAIPASVATPAPASTAVEMDNVELEDVYKGHDPLDGVCEQYNPSSQEEQPMDTNEGHEKVDILATAIIQGVGAAFSADLQQDYQGTAGRSYTRHEYHPTPTALSPLNSADETLADELLSERPTLVPTSEVDQLVSAASGATRVTSVTYDTTIQLSNRQTVEQGNSELVRLTYLPMA